jgi:hypothetical protein
MASWELFPKEWHANYAGHSIRVHNSWTGGAQLYVDGECRAATPKVFALDKKHPILRCEFDAGDGSKHTVEVFAYAVLTVRVKIVVDGQQVAGDEF